MTTDNAQDFFFLIDQEGNRYVPRKIAARDGRFGYAVHPVGKGNDASAAKYSEDERMLVQAVVFDGKGVRCRVEGGERDGQTNTVVLNKSTVRGYWLCPSRHSWVNGASMRPVNDKEACA